MVVSILVFKKFKPLFIVVVVDFVQVLFSEAFKFNVSNCRDRTPIHSQKFLQFLFNKLTN